MDSQDGGTPDAYNDGSKQDYMSEVVGKLSANGHASEINENNDIAVINYDAENSKNESEAKESRALLPFCIVFGFGSLFSSSIQTYMSSQITMLERTLGLSSSESGILLSANDIGFVATVLFASHFLHRYHIPRILGACILLFGLSGVLTGLPHFIMNEKMSYQDRSLANSTARDNNSLLCIEDRNNLTAEESCNTLATDSAKAHDDRKWVLGYMACMMIIQGIAKSARQPLSTTYVDNNARKERTGFYIGIMSTFGIFGPMIAITTGGLFSKLPVDLKETSLQPEDPRWVGAWWLGFIIFGICAVLISLPIFCFPAGRRLPGHNKKDEDNGATNSETETSCCGYLRDLPKSMFRVICCPVYTLNLVAVLCQIFSVMSLAAFGPKYIENQFQIPTWKANVIIGPEKLITTVLGTFGGGLLTRKLKLNTTGCIKLIVIARAISMSLNCFNFLFGCDNPPMIGLDIPSRLDTNLTCDCSSTTYLPVCADGQTFFSPCHAGCQQEAKTGFSQCLGSTTGDVTPGLCETGCIYLIPFVITNALASLIGTLVIAPSYVVVLRSVRDRDRTMAVGLMSFLLALLVFLPAPIVYGKLFDSLCLVWKSGCGQKGACSLYDVTGMRVKFIGTDMGLRIACIFFTVMTLLCSKRLQDNEESLNLEKDLKPTAEFELKNTNIVDKNSKERSNTQDDYPKGKGALHIPKEQSPNCTGHGYTESFDTGSITPCKDTGYVNVDIDQESHGDQTGNKPLPPIPNKAPKPSPRQSYT